MIKCIFSIYVYLIWCPTWSKNIGHWGGGALCVQMDFMQTFQTNAKCKNINHVWCQFYKILVVLKYRRRLWVNIFDTDICRCIDIQKKAKYTTVMHYNVGNYGSKNVSVKNIGSRESMVHQNNQNFIENTSNLIYIVALGVGLKCPHKIHLNIYRGGGGGCNRPHACTPISFGPDNGTFMHTVCNLASICFIAISSWISQ